MIYDEKTVSLREILLLLFPCHRSLLSINQQGVTVVVISRLGFIIQDEANLPAITVVQERAHAGSKDCSRSGLAPPVLAEDYHQDYLHPFRLLSLSDVTDAEKPLIDASNYEKPSQEVLKKNLTEESYRVTQSCYSLVCL